MSDMSSPTIDRLQIEINSSSVNASKGIDDLAKSLQNLKKSGTISTAVKNLNNLSVSLKNLPNVHGSANALRTLANSVERLKSVGSISTLTNSLGKLPGTLNALKNVNLTGLSRQIGEISDALAPLASVKAGGLGTTVNALRNLGKVTESLSEDTISAFAKKVEILTEKLGPLSAKMTTISAGFKSINSAARSASGGVDKFGDEVNTTTLNLATMITVIQGVAAALQPLIQVMTYAVGTAMEWDGIRYQFGNAFGEQADMYYEKITKITEALDINKQTFMENSAMSASMLIGFGVDKADAREMGVGYTELAYDIWAAYNNVYKSLEGADGAMAAIRSAISGEVEPIRRAGFTIIESTLQQTAANHGLEISIETATEAQKSYLRYLTLVDQAHSKGVVGTYAREMQTAEGMVRTFTQQLKSLAQAFGSLFLPILVKTMPYLQAFVELLTEGVHWIASLFGIEIQDIGDTWNDYSAGAGAIEGVADSATGATDALKDATKAAKELKNATIGIDELNVISPNSATGSSGSGGGAGSGGAGGSGFEDFDIESLWDESIFDGIQNKVDTIKEKLRGMFDDWLPTLQVIGGALAGWSIASLLGQLGDALKLGDDFAGKVTNIKKLAASAIIITIQFKLMADAFDDFMGEDGSILDYIEGVLIGAASTYLLYKQWGVGGLAIGLGVTAAVSLKTVIDAGGITDMESAVVALTGLATGIGAVAMATKALADAWKVVKSSAVISGFAEFFSTAKMMAPEVGWLAALFPKISSAIAGLPAVLSSATSALAAAGPWIGIVAVIVGGIVLAFVDYDFTEIGYTVGKKIGEAIRNTGVWIGEIGVAIWDGLKSAFEWLKDALDIDDIWDVFAVLFIPGEWIRRITPELKEILDGVIDWIDEKIENLKGNINEFFDGFFDGLFDGLGVDMSWADKFTEFFDIDYLDIVEMIMHPMSIGRYIWDGIWKGLTEGGIIEKFKTWCKNAIDAVKERFGIHSPSTVFASIGSDLIAGLVSAFKPSAIKDKIVSMWNTAKSWWDKKPSLKSYTPSIGSIYDKLKPRWDNAREWWNNKKSTMKTYTPSIGSIYEKVYDRWKNARDWWNSKKGSFKTYTPSIGSITDKLKSAWNSAKSWWSKNVKLSTKLNVSVPTIKVKWDTASAFGKSFKYPTGFSLKFAAAGGVFDQGSLIWAGERGPEVMANASGGRTGVMNIEQMQEAVYEGVYSAMIAAMRGNSEGGGSQPVNIYLDGRVIARSVEKAQRERGASIMGNEVYSY